MTPEQIEYMRNLRDDTDFMCKAALIVGNNNQPIGDYLRREILKGLDGLDAGFLDEKIMREKEERR